MNRQCLANSCVPKKLAARWRAESQLFAPNCERLGRGTADDLVESIKPTAVPPDPVASTVPHPSQQMVKLF